VIQDALNAFDRGSNQLEIEHSIEIERQKKAFERPLIQLRQILILEKSMSRVWLETIVEQGWAKFIRGNGRPGVTRFRDKSQ
jgi:hypothetical protein